MTSVEEWPGPTRPVVLYALEYVVALALAAQRLLAAVLVAEAGRVALVRLAPARHGRLHHPCNKQPVHHYMHTHTHKRIQITLSQSAITFLERDQEIDDQLFDLDKLIKKRFDVRHGPLENHPKL